MPKCIACGKQVNKDKDVYCYVVTSNNIFYMHMECWMEMVLIYKRWYRKWSD